MHRLRSSLLGVLILGAAMATTGCSRSAAPSANERRAPVQSEGAIAGDAGDAGDAGADGSGEPASDAAPAGAQAAGRAWSLRWLRPDVKAPPRLRDEHPQISQKVKVGRRTVTVEVTLASREGELVPDCRPRAPCVFTSWVRLGGRRLEAFRFRSAVDVENAAICGVSPAGRRLIVHCSWTDGRANDLGAALLDPNAGRLVGEPVVARIVGRPGLRRDDEAPDPVRPVPVWRDGRLHVAATAPGNPVAWLWDPQGAEEEPIRRCGPSPSGECQPLGAEPFLEDVPLVLFWRQACGDEHSPCLVPGAPERTSI